MKKSLILLAAFAMGISDVVVAQRPALSDREMFNEGKRLFVENRYVAARKVLDNYINKQSLATIADENLVEEAEYMTVVSAYYLREKDRFLQLLDYLIRYPETPYANRLHALAGNSLYTEEEYARALDCYERCEMDDLSDTERDEATLYKAICLLKEGRTDEAFPHFHVVETCSKTYATDATYYLAYIHYTKGNYDKALPLLESLENGSDYALKAAYYRADIYLNQARYNEAAKLAKEFIDQNPEADQLLEMRRIVGEAAYATGDYETAFDHLSAYVEHNENPSRNAKYKLGLSAMRKRAYYKAAEHLSQVTDTSDEVAQNAYLHLGLIYVELKDMTKARLAFEQASSMDFDRYAKEQALFNYALCIHETAYSGFGESVTVFERFLNEFPSSPYVDQVSDYLVDVYLTTRSYKAALQSIAKIKQPDERILQARQKIYYRLGTEALANADNRGAVDYFNHSLRDAQYCRQTKANAYFWRGEAYYRMGKYAEAATGYRLYLNHSAEENVSQHGTAYYNLGYTAFQQKSYTQARSYFERFLAQYRKQASPQMVADALNRKGDCYFYTNDYAIAREAYAEVLTVDPKQGDYALYQQAFVRGLQKDYAGKVAMLDKLLADYPQSLYADDALYESGRSYVQMEKNGEAIKVYDKLINHFHESSLARKAANEVGLLYYQDDKYDEAVTAYKFVIEKYPGSEEARIAQRDLKSVYIDLNKVDEFAEYAASKQGSIRFDSNERDSLTYLAAEKIYMRGDMPEAINSLTAYLQTFPDGAFVLNAHYYLGLAAYQKDDKANALVHLDKVLEYPDNKYSEGAIDMVAEIVYANADYEKSLTLYKLLRDKTTSVERIQKARLGILRSAASLQHHDEVIAAAGDLLSDSKLSPELVNEARYQRSRSAAIKGDTEQAGKDLQELAKDTRNAYGAEAKYRLAEMHFAAKSYSDAEAVLLDYIETSTPHAYWLARGFILLSDVYMQTGRRIEARQYLLSLQQNYTADDDIASRISQRLGNMNE